MRLQDYFGFLIIIFFSLGCKKDPDSKLIPPVVPASLTANAVSTSEIDLAWTDNSTNEDGFKLERKTATTNYTAVASLGKNSNSYRDQGLTKNTTYYYRVYSFNSAGNSVTYSNEAQATTADELPATATNLTAKAWSQSQVDLAWEDKANNETGYRIERKTANGSFSVLTSLPANANAYSDKGLAPVTEYTYRVFPYNSAGNGVNSNEATATTLPDILSGLIAYYPFTGNTGDSSGNANHGINYGATLTTDRFGAVDKAYFFNGTSAYINIIGNSLCTPVNEVSISVWMYVTNWTDNGGYFQATIIEEGGVQHYYHLQVGPQNTTINGPSSVNFQFNNTAYSSNINNQVNKNQWYNVILTKNSNGSKIYLGGQLIYSGVGYPYGNSGCPGSFFLGRETTPQRQVFFNGKMDDLRIYNRTLTDSEIQYLSNN